MSRDALVIGINPYLHLPSLRAPASDAEAIAQRLEQYGEFRVRRLPEFADPFEDNVSRIAHNTHVTLEQLETALVQLLKPIGTTLPDMALLFFSGHGLRKDRGIQEGYLATSDVNPEAGNWGLSLQWLRRLLQESEVRQQIVWLDCCYSGELLNFDEADPGDRGRGRDRCFISASREYEVAFEQTSGPHSVLTGMLLEALDPNRYRDGLITNFTLTTQLQTSPTLRAAAQHPLFANSGNKIVLIGKSLERSPSTLSGVCPYKGLTYFDCNEDDPRYFYGRTTLTDALLEKVRGGNFLAILGASGNGKSSVLRAGLLHQLKLGQRLSGSREWTIHIFRPGEHPLQSLALAFLDSQLSAIDRATQLAKVEALIKTGAIGLAQLAKATPQRLVLVIDQFEELFTVCHDAIERQEFLACLLGALDQAPSQLCVILAMRADFLSKCLEQEYAGLATKIQAHLVTVPPMNQSELTQAIAEPARQVGLEVEQELITQILTDVEQSPGSLPLVQYTLTELWKHRSVNWLTLAVYNQLGGVRGTLQKRADEVYAALSTSEQAIAQQIFLALTQLGEGTEDTRRQVPRQNLVSTPSQQSIVDRVIDKLSAERLLVTSQLVAKGAQSERIDVVDVAHEALIRYWPRLRQWVDENRTLLRQRRDLEDAAHAWNQRGNPNDIAYLLQGRKLLEVEDFLQKAIATVPLSSLTQDFIRQSQQARRRSRWRRTGIVTAIALVVVGAGGFAWYQRLKGLEASLIRDISLNRVRPEMIPIAEDLRQEADAIAAQGNRDDALSTYRAVLNFTRLLQKQADQPKPLLEQVQDIDNAAESGLVKLILTTRLPQLEADLRAGRIGKLEDWGSGADLLNIDGKTNGAIKTTYQLLLKEFGAKADLNDNGLIDNSDEANRIPCDLLKAIEALWRQLNQNHCGWYSQQTYSIYDDLDCSPLDGRTLFSVIFDFPYDPAVARLNACSIANKPLNPHP